MARSRPGTYRRSHRQACTHTLDVSRVSLGRGRGDRRRDRGDNRNAAVEARATRDDQRDGHRQRSQRSERARRDPTADSDPRELIVLPLATGNGGEGSSAIVLVAPTGRRAATLTPPHAGSEDNQPTWPPDGKWPAFTRTTDARRSFQIHVCAPTAQACGASRADSSTLTPRGRPTASRSPAAQTASRIVHPDGSAGRLIPTRAPSHVGLGMGARRPDRLLLLGRDPGRPDELGRPQHTDPGLGQKLRRDPLDQRGDLLIEIFGGAG